MQMQSTPGWLLVLGEWGQPILNMMKVIVRSYLYMFNYANCLGECLG